MELKTAPATGSARYNVAVLGLDDRNLETLREVRPLGDCAFHSLLSVQELVEADEIPFPELLDKADRQLRSFPFEVDAIVGYWDFPVSSMVPILCERFGLRGAPLRAVLTCEHKYWSRLEQHEVIEEHPAFGLVHLDDRGPPVDVGYPLWLKPVKSMSSELAFRVDDDEQFGKALAEIAEGIDRIGEPFQYVLDQVSLPREIAEAGGEVCLSEEAVSGRQVTVEGYHTGDEVSVYGIIDSHLVEGTPSFERYQYPSSLPSEVQRRLTLLSEKVIDRIGLTSVPFNIEYFWDPETDRIALLEINPRHSQSHALLFDYVDGLPNHQCMVRLALGQDPSLPHRQGRYAVAAKWFVRRFEDAVVTRVPTAGEIGEVEDALGGCAIDVEVGEGDRLSELPGQDSYSYSVCTVHIGADDEAQLRDKFERCASMLPFEFAKP